MAEHTAARLFSCALGNFARHDFANPTKSKLACLYVALHLFAMFRSCAFRDYDDRSQTTSNLPRLNHAGDLVVIERDFGNQNDIRSTGDAAMQRDPARMPSHHFDDHHSTVTGGGSVQPVERIDDDINSGIESERRGCGFEIVVNGLWNPDAIDPGLL